MRCRKVPKKQLDLYFLIFGNSDAPSSRHADSISQRLGRLAIAWMILPEDDVPRLWKTGITAVSHYSMNASGPFMWVGQPAYPDPVAGGRPPRAVSYCGPLFLQQVSNITTFCISVVYNGAQVSI